MVVNGCASKKPVETSKDIKDVAPVAGPQTVKKSQSQAEILILGDSQISFATGLVFKEFFENLDANCATTSQEKDLLQRLGSKSTAAIGVRSTSLHSWVARDDKTKWSICDIDKKYGVNAGTFGISKPNGRSYVQIGKGKDYQFCRKGRTPFEAMFEGDYYNPDLLVLSFLGNATDRWAQNSQSAQNDVRKTLAQIPPDMSCIFITTAPSFLPKVNDQRQLAQQSIQAAFKAVGGRCSFVDAITPKTRTASEGNKTNFATNSAGKVKDPYHPNMKGARVFIKSNTPKLCKAIFQQLAN